MDKWKNLIVERVDLKNPPQELELIQDGYLKELEAWGAGWRLDEKEMSEVKIDGGAEDGNICGRYGQNLIFRS